MNSHTQESGRNKVPLKKIDQWFILWDHPWSIFYCGLETTVNFRFTHPASCLLIVKLQGSCHFLHNTFSSKPDKKKQITVDGNILYFDRQMKLYAWNNRDYSFSGKLILFFCLQLCYHLCSHLCQYHVHFSHRVLYKTLTWAHQLS